MKTALIKAEKTITSPGFKTGRYSHKGAIILFFLLMFSGVAAFSGSPQYSITLRGHDGIPLKMPVKTEVAEELPFEITSIYFQIKDSIVNRQYDISSLVKPEPDADDLEINTRQIFMETMIQSVREKKAGHGM